MKKIITVYIICIHVFIGLVLIKSDFIERVEGKLGLTQNAQPEITPHFKRMVRYHSRMDDNVPDGAVIFIGDSHTQGLCVSAIAQPAVNYGIGSDTTVGVLQRLPKYKSINRAKAVVLAVGINDMLIRSNEEIFHNYKAIANQIPKNIPIVFSAIFPVDEEDTDQITNERVIKLNANLKSFTDKTSNLFFIDAGPSLIDAQENFADTYKDKDGIHLNSKGYAIWIQALRRTKVLISQFSYPANDI